jgi:hypothetical protein
MLDVFFSYVSGGWSAVFIKQEIMALLQVRKICEPEVILSL